MGKDVDRIELRSLTADEFVPWGRQVELGFGMDHPPDRTERWRAVQPLDRCWAALDGDRIVGTAAALEFDVSLPGADPRPCAGVTAVTVATDWRRRGLLRRMMRALLDQAHERGEPFAALYASESPIYGRFGFGIGAPVVDHVVDTVRCRVAEPVGTEEVSLVDVDTALANFPTIYEQARRDRAGMMARSPAWWHLRLAHDDRDDRDGYSPRQLALVPGRGLAIYRWKDDFDHYTPNGDVRVDLLVANDPEAESALWELLFDVDLTVRVRARMRPPDDALPHLVDNRALVRDTGGEHLYLRLVDVPAALTARRYAGDGEVRLEVTDATCAWNAGTWRLAVVDGEATCEKVDGHGDVALDVAALASVSLGGVRLDHLVRARRAAVRAPSTVATVDRLFAVDRAPWNPFEF